MSLPLDTPARLRRWGLTVVEVDGWQTRGLVDNGVKRPLHLNVLVAHHTGTPLDRHPGDIPTMPLLIRGRWDLRGPLCNFGLSRSGVVHVVASGVANHAGAGGWAGFRENENAVGIEAENPGDGRWPPGQLAAYDLLCAALLADVMHQPPSRLCSHHEWAGPRKNDPYGIPMDTMRDHVAKLIRTGPPTTEENQRMLCAILDHVERRYREIAGRAPDAPGRAAWVTAFHNAETDPDVASRPGKVLALDDRLVAGLTDEANRRPPG